MKELLKEYFTVEGAKARVAGSILLTLLYSVVNSRITIWISTIVESTSDSVVTTKYLNLLIMGLLVNIAIGYLKQRILETGYHTAYTKFNNKIADKVLDVDYDVFAKYSAGFIQTIINSAHDIAAGGKVLVAIIQYVMDFIIITVSICIIEIKLIIPIIVIYSLGGLLISKIWNKIFEIDRQCDDLMHTRNDEIQKIISGFAEIRSNCTQEFHKNKIRKYNFETRSKFYQKIKVVAIDVMTMEIIDSIITLVAVMYAIIYVPQGLASSVAMSLVIYSWRLLNPLCGAIAEMDEVSTYTAKYKKHKEFMTLENKVVDGDIELSSFDSSIKINHVSFSYENSDKVLNDISLEIKKGEKIGICGYSGGGKSTLLKLIPRLYDVTDGEILVDGIDIRKLNQNSLRRKIGVVHQSNYIFKGSIYNNVIYGVENVTMDRVIEACKKACIYDFIISLPDGFNTDVGPNGLKLSGGQQQRIAIARIFLSNPDIILLDEATSALDNESEVIIQDSLKLFEGKTIITVAHRLSTIQDSDRIVVIDEHQIAEEGTHDELMNNKGLYYDLYTAKEV